FRAHERSTRGNAVASQGRTSAKTGYTTSRDAITVETAEWQEDGWREWLLWSEVCAEESPSEFMRGLARDSVEMLRADEGRTLGFVRVVGRRL
ncbi:hypothetical protein ACFFRO_20605, partial [Streptomyces thermocoprophilus]